MKLIPFPISKCWISRSGKFRLFVDDLSAPKFEGRRRGTGAWRCQPCLALRILRRSHQCGALSSNEYILLTMIKNKNGMNKIRTSINKETCRLLFLLIFSSFHASHMAATSLPPATWSGYLSSSDVLAVAMASTMRLINSERIEERDVVKGFRKSGRGSTGAMRCRPSLLSSRVLTSEVTTDEVRELYRGSEHRCHIVRG